MDALEDALATIEKYDPDAILISLGVDTADTDPEGHFMFGADDYFKLGKRVGQLCSGSTCSTRAVVLEGGYDLKRIGNDVKQFLVGLHNVDQDAESHNGEFKP